MALRSRFEHERLQLQRRLMELGITVERAIAFAVVALLQHDATAATRVVERDTTIDTLRYDIEAQALSLLARQQPFAGDLRMISAIMGIASELERIGDYAKGIATIVTRARDLTPLAPPPALQRMATEVRTMLRVALHAVDQRDPAVAGILEHADDLVDSLYQETMDGLVALMHAEASRIEAATYLVWAAHDLERIGDRAVNIAERAAFVAEGPATLSRQSR